MPFSRDQFLTVFAAYNHDIWPMQAVLFFLAIAVIATAVENRRASMMILAALWAWCGIAYHWMEFTRVNPAAWAFGFVFLAGAALLLRQPAEFVDVPPVRLTVGGAFIAYALIVYPLIGGIAGHAYPQSATFGAPCPLTIFTLGILMLLKPPLPWVPALPAILWAIIATAAIFQFGMIEDIALPLAAATYVALLLHDHGVRVTVRFREVRHA